MERRNRSFSYMDVCFTVDAWSYAVRATVRQRLMNTLIGNERELKRAVDDGADTHASAVSAFEYGDVA